MDDGLEGIVIQGRCEQFGTTGAPSHQLMVNNIDVRNAMLLEEIEDVIGRFECDLASESIGQDAHPNCDRSGNHCPVWGELDVGVLNVRVFPIIPVIFVVLILLVVHNPAEMNKVDGQMLNVLLVEKLYKLGMNFSPQIAVLRECHKP